MTTRIVSIFSFHKSALLFFINDSTPHLIASLNSSDPSNIRHFPHPTLSRLIPRHTHCSWTSHFSPMTITREQVIRGCHLHQTVKISQVMKSRLCLIYYNVRQMISIFSFIQMFIVNQFIEYSKIFSFYHVQAILLSTGKTSENKTGIGKTILALF